MNARHPRPTGTRTVTAPAHLLLITTYHHVAGARWTVQRIDTMRP